MVDCSAIAASTFGVREQQARSENDGTEQQVAGNRIWDAEQHPKRPAELEATLG